MYYVYVSTQQDAEAKDNPLELVALDKTLSDAQFRIGLALQWRFPGNWEKPVENEENYTFKGRGVGDCLAGIILDYDLYKAKYKDQQATLRKILKESYHVR